MVRACAVVFARRSRELFASHSRCGLLRWQRLVPREHGGLADCGQHIQLQRARFRRRHSTRRERGSNAADQQLRRSQHGAWRRERRGHELAAAGRRRAGAHQRGSAANAGAIGEPDSAGSDGRAVDADRARVAVRIGTP